MTKEETAPKTPSYDPEALSLSLKIKAGMLFYFSCEAKMAGMRSPIFSLHNGFCQAEEHICKIQYPIKAQVHLPSAMSSVTTTP